MNQDDFLCVSLLIMCISVLQRVFVAMPISSPRGITGNKSQINPRAKKASLNHNSRIATACSHFFIGHILCWWHHRFSNQFWICACSKWHWPTGMKHGRAERFSWTFLQKSQPGRETEWRKEECNEKGSHCCKGIRVQRNPDTGILLNKARIVQRKLAQITTRRGFRKLFRFWLCNSLPIFTSRKSLLSRKWNICVLFVFFIWQDKVFNPLQCEIRPDLNFSLKLSLFDKQPVSFTFINPSAPYGASLSVGQSWIKFSEGT